MAVDLSMPLLLDAGKHGRRTRVRIDALVENDLLDAKECFTQNTRTGEGTGMDELTDGEIDQLFAKAMQCNLKQGYALFGIWEINEQTEAEEGGAFCGVLLLRPCHLVRSSHPIQASGYLVVKKEYHHLGLSTIPEFNSMIWKATQGLGYLGYSAKANVMARIYGMVYHLRLAVVGIIPESLRMEKFGRVADTITYSDGSHIHGERLAAMMRKYEEERHKWRLPPFDEKTFPPPSSTAVDIGEKIIQTDDKNDWIKICTPNDSKILAEVEMIMRKLAEIGESFGNDEFDNNGFFNRRLLRHSHTCAVLTPGGSVLGGAIFGPSNLTRSVTTKTLALYTAVKHKCHLKQLIVRNLVIYIMNWAKKIGYESILMDVYENDYDLIQVLQGLGFLSYGSIPNSGYLIGKGFTNCHIYHRRLVPVTPNGHLQNRTHISKL